jgi:ABC-type antimicrobial peptide transport system permease subunit
MGIRMALGARPGQLIGGILRGGVALVGIGAAAGFGGAWFAARLIGNLLAGVSTHDPGAYLAVVALLMGAEMLATFFPARRAATVDPVQALKSE